MQHNRFPEYQQKVSDRRRKHGLEGDVILLEDRDQQSKPGHVTMENWMEYQDAVILVLERFEKKVEERHKGVKSAQEVLADARIPEYGDENRIYEELTSAKRDLELAQKRLEAAQSDNFGETVERAAWIRLFQKEVQPAQARLGEASKGQKEALEARDDARMAWVRALEEARKASGEANLEPPEAVSLESLEARMAWLDARDVEDRKAREDGRKRKEKEKWEWGERRYMGETEKWHSTREEMELAEAGLKAAQWDDFGETVGRAALVRLIREEVESAQTRRDEAKAGEARDILRHELLSARQERGQAKRKLKRHRILMEWIERQRQAMVSERAASAHDAENHDDQGLTERPKQRILRNHSTQASRLNPSSEGFNLERTRAQTRSVLTAIDPARVSKARGKEKPSRPKMSISSGASQSAQAASIDPSVSHPRSKRMSKAKDAMPTPLRLSPSSKVSKSKGRRPSRLQWSGIEVIHNKRELRPRSSSARSVGRKPPKLAGIPTRSRTRISKKPERFGGPWN